jgi:hypothetical protein
MSADAAPAAPRDKENAGPTDIKAMFEEGAKGITVSR